MIPKPSSCIGCQHAYNAGLLDGEGHISVAKRPHGRGAAVTVGMTNTNLDLLAPFMVYGGSIGKPRIRGLGHKKQYAWAASSANAIRALESMLPYLVRLKDRATIALKILKTTPSKGKHLSDAQAGIISKAVLEFYAA